MTTQTTNALDCVAPAAPCPPSGSLPAWTYRPNVDIHETGDAFVLVADVPGAASDEIEVTFQDDTLSLHAPVHGRVAAGATLHRQEYGVGGFHRRFVIDADVDAEGITAECTQGVLTVRLPKAAEEKGRRIEVRGG